MSKELVALQKMMALDRGSNDSTEYTSADLEAARAEGRREAVEIVGQASKVHSEVVGGSEKLMISVNRLRQILGAIAEGREL